MNVSRVLGCVDESSNFLCRTLVIRCYDTMLMTASLLNDTPTSQPNCSEDLPANSACSRKS
jgi:hypothetical protein